MHNRRAKQNDRRRNGATPAFPFMDRHGALISACRRQRLDRRRDSIQAAMVALSNQRRSNGHPGNG